MQKSAIRKIEKMQKSAIRKIEKMQNKKTIFFFKIFIRSARLISFAFNVPNPYF